MFCIQYNGVNVVIHVLVVVHKKGLYCYYITCAYVGIMVFPCFTITYLPVLFLVYTPILHAYTTVCSLIYTHNL
jgi:hypothetical protein